MKALLLVALWGHLASGVLLTGAFFMLLLAGSPRALVARRWDEAVVAWSRLLVFLALGSGIVWLMARTAVFENRPTRRSKSAPSRMPSWIRGPGSFGSRDTAS